MNSASNQTLEPTTTRAYGAGCSWLSFSLGGPWVSSLPGGLRRFFSCQALH